jgi:hypothetical protein
MDTKLLMQLICYTSSSRPFWRVIRSDKAWWLLTAQLLGVGAIYSAAVAYYKQKQCDLINLGTVMATTPMSRSSR